MKKRISLILWALCLALAFSGCSMRTIDDMYRLPKRSETDSHLQSAIDAAMVDLSYSAPISGENQQTVQLADLDGDGENEYIVFARSDSDKTMRLLIFKKTGDKFSLTYDIPSHGSAFERVEYVDIDGKPGLEILVGSQVSDQIMRSLSVYSFAGGSHEQLLAVNYFKFLTCDLNQDGKTEIMLIRPGHTDADRGVAVLYSYEGGELARTREAELSASADSVRRIMVSKLHSGEPAVYVASAVFESAVMTDIFALKNGRFTNISLSSESGTSVQTMRNYYVYADDMDGDGGLELPDLITMKSIVTSTSSQKQYLIRWYSMDNWGQEHTKCYTFHNFLGGWYMELESTWAERTSVVQSDGCFWFYVWDRGYQNATLLFSVRSHSGANREEAALADNQFILYRADGIIYSARLENGAVDYDITQENLIPCFHLIHQDWKTGET